MKDKVFLIVFIISFILAAVIINVLQQLFMKLIGAKVMFFNGKAKLFLIFLLGAMICGLIMYPFRSLWG